MFADEYWCLDCGCEFPNVCFAHESGAAPICPACGSVAVRYELEMWARSVLTYGPGGTITDGFFENCVFGFVVRNSMVRGRNLVFRGNNVAIDAGNSYLDMDGLTIE